MKKFIATILTLFMFFGVPFPVYALDQQTQPPQVGLEETTPPPIDNASSEVEEPETPAVEETDLLSPENKQEDVSTETETKPDIELETEEPETKEPEIKESASLEEAVEEPKEEPKEEPLEETPGVAEETKEEELPDEEVIYAVNTAVNFTKAGPLLPPVLGAVSALESSKMRTMGTMGLLAENDHRTTTTSQSGGDSSVVLKKNAAYDEASHTVEITLEAFATGEFTTIIEHIPADIVLVLDQSGSMQNDMNGTEVTNAYLYDISSTLFAKDSEGNLRDVTVTRSEILWWYTYTYSYVHTNGQTISSTNRNNFTFYNGTTAVRRVDVLKDATARFVDDVYQRAEANDVDHRISMIGFASGDTNDLAYENTEILSPLTATAPIPWSERNSNSNLRDSLLDVRNHYGRLMTSIGWIEASGATRTDLGMNMAEAVLTQNPVPADTQRQRVVIMFTDGTPTMTNTFNTTVANSTIATARTMKNTLGATSFTIGIFNGANPNGTSDENEFMNFVSSNYPNAQSMTNPGTGSPSNGYYLSTNNAGGLDEIFQSISNQVGNPMNNQLTGGSKLRDLLAPQFLFSDTFNSNDVDIKVYKYIGSGGDFEEASSWSLQTPNPAGLSVLIDKPSKQLDVTGFDYAGNFVAFDETTNTPRGKKIQVTFTVDVREDFIGGNKVVTNIGTSGIYTPQGNFVQAFTIPVVDIPLRFEAAPQDQGIYISQSIPSNKLMAGDALSYQINGVTYTVDGINNAYANIDYVLNDQDGVTPLRSFRIAAGQTVISNEVNTMVGPLTTTDYDFDVTVTPTLPGTVVPLEDVLKATVYLWLPTVEAADETLWWGEDTDLLDRMIHTGWVEEVPGAVVPYLAAPSVTLAPSFVSGSAMHSIPHYEPEVDSLFMVDLFIGNVDYTAYMRINVADSAVGHTGFHFTVFVKKATLTIEKALVPGAELEENQSFLFEVVGPTGTYQVALQGTSQRTIEGLKIGEYTVKEILDWSFRYDLEDIQVAPTTAKFADVVEDGVKVTLAKTHPDVTVTFVNDKTSEKWLSGDSFAVNLQTAPIPETAALQRREEEDVA